MAVTSPRSSSSGVARAAVVILTTCCLLCAAASQGCEYWRTDLLTSCGSRLDAIECGMVTAQGSTRNASASDCRLSLPVPPGRRMVVSVESALVRNPHILSRRCDSYFRVLHDPTSTGDSAVALSRAICSHELDQQVFHVPNGTAQLLLHTTGPKYIYLTVVYTSLAQGPCNRSQFQCGTGPTAGACAASGLVCDGHNNCGDGSDESRPGSCQGVPSFSYQVRPLVSLACGAVVLLTAAFSVFYCTRPREPRWYRLAKGSA